MTDTKHAIPILEQDRAIDSDAFFEFVMKLVDYVDQWIPEIAVPIMRNADKLFAEPAVRILLDAWHRDYTIANNDSRARLLRAAKHDEYSWEAEGELEEFVSSFFCDRCDALSDALYILLVE